MSYLIQVHGPVTPLTGQYLQGPRSPKKVARDGYGFTADPDAAWPFPSHALALAKARIVDAHMGWSPRLFVTEPQPAVTLGLRLSR